MNLFGRQALERLARIAPVGRGHDMRCQFNPHCKPKRGKLEHHWSCIVFTAILDLHSDDRLKEDE